VIRKPKKKEQGLASLTALITQRMMPINLLDSLIDTELWLNLTRFFKPKSGYDAKIERPGNTADFAVESMRLSGSGGVKLAPDSPTNASC
jgi:hypothetical protein